MINDINKKLSSFLTEHQFKQKIPFYFFIVNIKYVVLLIFSIYLFFGVENRNFFENFIMVASVGYVIYSYVKSFYYKVDFISDEKNNVISFIKRLKYYVYKKNS